MTSRAVKPGSRRCAVQGGAWERRNCGRRGVRLKPNSPGGEKLWPIDLTTTITTYTRTHMYNPGRTLTWE